MHTHQIQRDSNGSEDLWSEVEDAVQACNRVASCLLNIRLKKTLPKRYTDIQYVSKECNIFHFLKLYYRINNQALV